MVPFAGNEFERSRRSGKMTRIAVVAGDRGSFVSGSWLLALGAWRLASAGAIDTEQNRIDIHSLRRVIFSVNFSLRCVTLLGGSSGWGASRWPQRAQEPRGGPGLRVRDITTPGFRRAGSAAWGGSARWERRAPDGQVPRAPVVSLASQVADAYGGKGNFPHVRRWVKLPLPLLGGPPRPPSARRAGRPVSPCPRFRVPVVVVRTGGGQWAGGGGGSAWRRP